MDIVTHKEPSVPVKILPCDVWSVSCPHSSIKMFQKHNRRLYFAHARTVKEPSDGSTCVLLALQYLESSNLRFEIKLVLIWISLALLDL